MRVLVINAGSSSLKHALVENGRSVVAAREERWEPEGAPGRHGAALRTALADADEPPDAIGHRVVHGGSRFRGATRLDTDVRRDIEALVELAPLHNLAALE